MNAEEILQTLLGEASEQLLAGVEPEEAPAHPPVMQTDGRLAPGVV